MTAPPQTTLGILVPCLTFASAGFLCILIFCIVHHLFKDIYSPRRLLQNGKPPPIPKGFFKWFKIVYLTEEEFLVNSIGLDAVMMLRFFKLGMKFFGLLSIFGLFVVAPVYYYSNQPNLDGISGYELEAILIRAITIENVPQQSSYLSLILVFTWLLSIISYAFLISFFRNYITLKLQHDQHALEAAKESNTNLRSVMIFGVPRELRSEICLAKYFENLCIGQVETVVVCRNWTRLQKAVKKRAYYLEQLEYLVAKFGEHQSINIPQFRPSNSSDIDLMITEIKIRFRDINRKSRPRHRNGLFGKYVDSVEYYCDEFEKWDKLVKILRETPENSEATGVAFVTFESASSATIASQCVTNTDPFSMIIRMAPEPRDVYWTNISGKTAHSYSKFFRSIIANLGMLILVFSSTFVVYSIAALLDLQQLALIFPWFGNLIKDIPKMILQFVQGVIPTVLLSLWNAALPSVLLLLCHFQGLEAESWIQESLLRKYFYYLIWNVVFVIPLSSSVLYTIIFNPQEIIEKLGQMLPKSSRTMINYMMLQGLLVYPAQLLLAGPLIMNWFLKKFRVTPRQWSDSYYPSVLAFFSYGAFYPIPALMFCIGFMYAPIAPLILPFCFAFFTSGYFIHKAFDD
jgi:hypothetical protein